MYTPLGDPVKPSEKVVFPAFHGLPPWIWETKRSAAHNATQWGPDSAPGSKHEKDARRKIVQNPAGIN